MTGGHRVAVGLLLLLMACGGGGIQALSPSPSASPSISPSPFVSPPPTGPPVYAMGHTATSQIGSKVTVYRWSKNVPSREGNPYIKPSAGSEFSQAILKFCPAYEASAEPIHGYEVSQFFSLVMRDRTVISASSVGYPGEIQSNEAVLAHGQCVKGPLVFESPKGRRPAFVQFASSSIIMWRVP